MPPRPKRTRLHPARTTTRSKAQAATQAPSKPAAGPSGPAPRRNRSNLIMEVVLPPSKKPTPKTSSALTPDSVTAVDLQLQQEETDQDILNPTSPPFAKSPPARASTPRVAQASDKGKQKMDSLPPSSPPPDSSPERDIAWDGSSRGSTPTPSLPRSRQASRQGGPIDISAGTVGDATGVVLVPGTPSSEHRATQLPTPNSSPPPVSASAIKPPSSPGPGHKPPTSPIPYSDTVAPDDPFGFAAAEDRLRERRAMLERENPQIGFGMPSSGGPEDFDESTYEEAFASIFYDPESGTIDPTQTSATGSDKENAGVGLGPNRGNGKLKAKRTLEVVIPTKARSKGKEGGVEKEKEKEEDTVRESPERTSTRRKGKAKEHVLTTYELEAMLPRRPKRARKPRDEEAEEISLSEGDDDDDEDTSPKRRKKTTASRGRAATRGKTVSRGAKGKEAKAGTSKSTGKTAARSSKRTRSFDTAHMDDETRK
ncbi:hypothetical protein FRC07_005233, partial [Ceratobasidium sp. 392]